ncbi:unnamed protein product [Rhizoctonia solani]|uniref:Uncharacterized protein n=1 Tax=Rhizoctonia solani TaxID=456999 RepID=A0A8H3EES5_9AGAM|nr:unnamed protein product [Rhizoctonia solani]
MPERALCGAGAQGPKDWRLWALLGQVFGSPTPKPAILTARYTHQKSQYRELIEFGEYVDRLVQQSVSALESDQLIRQANVVKSLEDLQKTLYSILQRISAINDSGGLKSRRHILSPDEDYIGQMRRQLDDALNAFQFGAFLEMLKSPPGAGGTAMDPSKFCQPQTPQPSDPLAPMCSCQLPQQVPQGPQPPQDNRVHRPRPNEQIHPRRAIHHHPPIAVAQAPEPQNDEITIAFMSVERCRPSFRHSPSYTSTMRLATALGQLSEALGKAGRVREAFEASKESAELYRSLSDKLR